MEACIFYMFEVIYSLDVSILTCSIKSAKLDPLFHAWNKIRRLWRDLLLSSKSFSPPSHFVFPLSFLVSSLCCQKFLNGWAHSPPSSFLPFSLPSLCPSLGFNGLLQLLRRTALRYQATPWKEAHAAAAQTERARLLQWCCGLISTAVVLDTKGNISRVEG